jgi:ATP-binding protein involved in chromosome partitioning
MLTPADVLDALRRVRYPGFSRDIVSFGIVRDVEVGGFGVRVVLAPPADAPDLAERLRGEIESVIADLPGAGPLTLESDRPAPARPPVASGPRGARRIEGVRHVVAVASGKGGVGKSTVAANLAVALEAHGSVGLLDADVYGPSAPLLLGVEGREAEVSAQRRITPVEAHGLRMISMGFFVDQERPIIWRGPMVTKLVVEFLQNVDWGPLDYLVLDLPPGTGDVQLTLSQQLSMTGGVIVTTPQEVALADVRRGLKMFAQVNVPVLGLVENMSGFVCGSCGHETEILGRGGGERTAARLEIPFLGAIPLTPLLERCSDAGTPLVSAHPEHPVARRFAAIAATVASNVEAAAARSSS